MIIKPRDEHRSSIRNLLKSAFEPSHYEAVLIDELVKQGEPFFEWIILQDGAVKAYIAYTAATNKSGRIGYHLAPVAVAPDEQGKGLGTRLICQTLGMEELSEESIFVLGDPLFYERFGFTQTTTVQCPFDEGNAHFRALRWIDTAKEFTVGYSPAFQLAE